MEKQNVSISGSGKIGGGKYADVRISGSGRVEGDVEADEIRISGAGKVEGNAKAKEISVSGSGRFMGSVEAEIFHASGGFRVEGDVEAGELRCSGSGRISGGVRAQYVRASGALAVAKDVAADIFSSSGALTVQGLLSADRVEIKLGGRCRVGEIGGERIDVRQGAGFNLQLSLVRGFRLGRFGTGELVAETIEGDEIHLEGTQAKLVRGKQVTVGPGCHIERVEYEESLEVDPSSRVGEEVRG